MSDVLEQVPDAELSEVFAVEVAGYRRLEWKDRKGRNVFAWSHKSIGDYTRIPDFATSADAVLRYLNQVTAELDHSRISDWHIRVYQGSTPRGHTGYDGTAPTFARAACIALIRAKRAEKGQP